MKKLICLILVLSLLLLTSCGLNNNGGVISKSQESTSSKNSVVSNPDYIRAVWINYNELAMKSVGGGNSEQFKQKIEAIFNNIVSMNMNRVIVQVRPYSDAFYKSSIFPATEYLTGTQGIDPGYDALAIMVESAHKKNLKIDAWINPYRVSYKNDINALSDNNPAKIWFNENNSTEDLIMIDKGIFYNPASQRAQKLILDGVREILSNYNVDGIHMDDYFYPVTDEFIDSKNYNDYLSQGGTLTLTEWRRENVNSFVSGLYTIIKNTKPEAQFTISPGGNIDKNMNEYYADVELWCSESGYVDIIMPQLYYGFENQNQPFSVVADQWSKIVKCKDVKLCFGLAVYKWDKEDKYAGSGINEWQNKDDISKRQLEKINTISNSSGIAFYSYSYLFEENMTENAKKELQNMKSML